MDVRIVAATNRDPEEMVEDGKFREDLFYRLNVYSIELPPLRERQEDIELISEYFIRLFNKEYGKNIKGIEREALDILVKYSWPGNVRELRNIIIRSMISASGTIKKKNLPSQFRKNIIKGTEFKIQTGTPLPEIERVSIIKTLQLVRGNKLKAAETLGISRRSLYNKIEEYKILDEEYS